jgi:hypothetical protein
MAALPVLSLRVQLAWYPWYQNSVAGPKCLASEVVKNSVLSGIIGRVPNIGSQYVHSMYKVQSAHRGLGRWKVRLETIFVSSLFKGLSKRDATVVEHDKFLLERSKQILEYNMVTELHLINNQYHCCLQYRMLRSIV